MVEKKKTTKAKFKKNLTNKNKITIVDKNKTNLKNKKVNKNVKEDMNRNKKAQVSLEMIIIIGVLILGAVILASVLIGFTGEKVDQAGEIDKAASSTINDFINDLTNPEDYQPIDGVGNNCVLTLNRNPVVGGSVTGSGTYACGTSVTVTATASSGYTFNNWSIPTGSVSSSTYNFVLNSNTTLTANFSSTTTPPINYNLTLLTTGSGTAIQSGSYASGSTVKVKATPAPGNDFVNWTNGGTQVSVNQNYSFTMPSKNLTLTANFSVTPPGSFTLNLTKDLGGTAISSPSGINCLTSETNCSNSFSAGTSVEITASVPGGSISGWSGCDSANTGPGVGTCTVLMNSNKNITLGFSIPTNILSVTKLGSGQGTVTSTTDLGINCGADCSESYNNQTIVTLQANPSAGSIFEGWKGDCDGENPTCTVTMDQAKDVIVGFSLIPPPSFNLTVTKNNVWAGGSVTSNVSGIDCGTDCSHSYYSGTYVTLTANPISTFIFSGWTGNCTGSSPTCSLTMDQAKTVNASFVYSSGNILHVTINGSGSVNFNPPNSTCQDTCSKSYVSTTGVVLTAIPDTDYVFDSWSGACSGTSTTCNVYLNQSKSATANFTYVDPTPTTYNLNVVNSSNGTVTSNIGGINCGSSCSSSYKSGTNVTLTSNPASGYVLTGWNQPDCGSQNTCVVPMNISKTVTPSYMNLKESVFNLYLVNGTSHELGLVGAGKYRFKDDVNIFLIATESGQVLTTQSSDYYWINRAGEIVSNNGNFVFSMPQNDEELTLVYK